MGGQKLQNTPCDSHGTWTHLKCWGKHHSKIRLGGGGGEREDGFSLTSAMTLSFSNRICVSISSYNFLTSSSCAVLLLQNNQTPWWNCKVFRYEDDQSVSITRMIIITQQKHTNLKRFTFQVLIRVKFDTWRFSQSTEPICKDWTKTNSEHEWILERWPEKI